MRRLILVYIHTQMWGVYTCVSVSYLEVNSCVNLVMLAKTDVYFLLANRLLSGLFPQ